MRHTLGPHAFGIIALGIVLPFVFGADRNLVRLPDDAVLRFRLQAQAAYSAGQDVNIIFTLENASDEALYVLTWYTPLEGLKGGIFKVTRDGQEVLYEGRMVKRGDPAREDYARIGPGESASAVVELSSVYNLRPPGEYRVEFDGRIHDVACEGEPLPRTGSASRPMDIQGNAVTFSVHD